MIDSWLSQWREAAPHDKRDIRVSCERIRRKLDIWDLSEFVGSVARRARVVSSRLAGMVPPRFVLLFFVRLSSALGGMVG